ncbi:hypothetical protein [Peptacetobacter hiranonis]|uniref:Uncharacterized protein n=1 Tax=Peptacetobacter hiranonis (strain DSM 13275 / JCM 10541 / KCTC 15199 / TO-931) TaxID=500633 RepID=B6FZX6_PEPHT|nr:hypothetical protein [Peptacetobacter hiranonis]EEA84949.1 hypothetical protein CLOHIR_01430 [Peptacetobacter hiranonis DSM 13275]QEK20789.1 hypothetical protein KGNDJEFE_01276 [Peptacetobacter hiranonis]
MDIIKALKLAKEQGMKVRPVGFKEIYIVFEDGVFLVKMSDVEYKYKLEIYSDTIEPLVLGEWEEATTEVDTRIIERKRKAIKMYCHNLNASCKECYVNKICDEYQKIRIKVRQLGYLDNPQRIENWSFKDVNEAYQILIKKKVKFKC